CKSNWKQRVPMKVLNLNLYPVVLNKNTQVGEYETIEEGTMLKVQINDTDAKVNAAQTGRSSMGPNEPKSVQYTREDKQKLNQHFPLTHLEERERQELREVIHEYRNVFALSE